MSIPLEVWLRAFLWTLALELPLYALLLRGRLARWWAPVALALAVNALTHPLLWYVFPRFEPYEAWLVAAEAWVTLTEAALVYLALRHARPGEPHLARALLAALAANAASTLAGLLFFEA